MNNEMAKVAIVTGAAKNIGRATCESLSKLGYNILVHANTDKDGAEETVNLVKQNNVQSTRIIGDLTKPETSQELIKEASKLGTISALVNNASQREFNKFDDMTFDEWRFVMSINLDSLFHTCKAVLPEMKKMKTSLDKYSNEDEYYFIKRVRENGITLDKKIQEEYPLVIIGMKGRYFEETINLINYLNKNKKNEIYFLMGADN